MDILTAILAILVAIAILFEVARRLGIPYPSLFVLGGLALGFTPGIPRIHLEPELVLLVFLPPLLFSAAIDTPLRDLKANLAPILRLSFGLVLFTMAIVAGVVHFAAGLDWPAAFVFGAIVGPTDAIAATSVFRRLGMPRVVVTLVEGESLFNDATALVAYRFALLAVASGTFIVVDAVGGFAIATVGGIVVGAAGRARRQRDPPAAGRPARRGAALARDPVRRLPAGRTARAFRRARGGHGGPDRRQPARDQPDAEQPDPVAEHVEDGRVRPERLCVRADRAGAAEGARRARRTDRRSSSLGWSSSWAPSWS